MTTLRPFVVRCARQAFAAGSKRLALAVVATLPARLAGRSRFCWRRPTRRLVTLDDSDRNQLLGEALDLADVEVFGMMNQRDGQTIAAGTAGTTDAVHVVLGGS